MRRALLPLALSVGAAVSGGCDRAGTSPRRVPSAIALVETPGDTAVVGSVAGAVRVAVTDADGAPVPGVVVTFAVSRGAGRVAPAADTTRSDGTVQTTVTLGTTPGGNEVVALVTGVSAATFSIIGIPGPTHHIVVAPLTLRMSSQQNTATVSATARDEFGNATGASVVWTARDPAVVSIAGGGTAVVTARQRPAQTYVVAQSESRMDSVRVTIEDASSGPCAFVSRVDTLALGGALSFDAGSACVFASDAGAEYAVVAHFNTAVAATTARVLVTASGIVSPTTTFPEPAVKAAQLRQAPRRDVAFEMALRDRERREIGPRVAGAREWFDARAAGRRPALRTSLREGELLRVNVNAFDFCSNPDLRTMRVAAITNGAVVLADVANPPGGFTDEEYRSFGMMMDTLVVPVDTAAFGAPADVDGDRKIAIVFTSAVNAMSQPGVKILGFYYIRDLLPKTSPFGDCPGSNVGELVYVLVPDPEGSINSNVRTKGYVDSVAVSVIAHEYQHLINASRRMYVTRAPQVDEEVWLNEGLSHIAEELIFYRVSGRTPRQNIDGAQLGTFPLRDLFESHQSGNFDRYREYLRAPETSSPLSRNDFLATRGATWSFLRYLADRTRATDGDFWRRLVDSRLIGVPNLDDVLSASEGAGGAGGGTSTLAALRDWSVAVLGDDVPGVSAVQQHPSWNFRSVMSAVGMATPFGLQPRILADRVTTNVLLSGGATSYLRFAVPQGQQAFVQASGPGGVVASGMRLTILRIK